MIPANPPWDRDQNSMPLLQQISVIHHKDRYLSTYTQYFQELILKYFHEVEQIPIEKLVNSSSVSLQ